MMPGKKNQFDQAVDGAAEDLQAAAPKVDNHPPGFEEFMAGEPVESADQLSPKEGMAADIDLSPDEENLEAEPVPLNETEQLQMKLAEAESKVADHWDRLLRLQADMENQRKRAQNDVAKARKFALEGIVGDLLPVKDSLEMGLANAEADPKAIIEGADMTVKMLSQVFEKNNIFEVNPIDEKFDPEFHQAMSMQEVEGIDPNTVTGVMQKGYTLNDRLVRPALVMVAK